MAPLLLSLISILPTIWIVDASNGPGTNFTDLPAAVAAAVGGDTILVRAGNYTCFSVSGKALTIRGAGASTTTVGTVPGSPPFEPRIDNVPAGTTFYIDGLTFNPSPYFGTGVPSPPVQAGLYVLGATTRVVLADVIVIGAFLVTGSPPTGTGYGTLALYVAGGAEVHASRCTFTGAGGTWSGGSGAYVSAGCRLVAEASTFSGGSGAALALSGSGGGGLFVANGVVTASRSSFFGGPGGAGGGDAINVSGAGGFVRLAVTSADMIGGGGGLFGGAPGYALFVAPGASAQVHGVPTVVLPSPGAPVWTGTVNTGQPLPYLSASGTAAGGGELLATQPVTVTVNGLIPFAPFTCIVDFGPAFSAALAPMLLGEILVPVPPAGILQGTLDAFGMMQTTFTPTVAAPSLVNVPLYAQFGVLDSTIGQVRLSNGPVWFFKN